MENNNINQGYVKTTIRANVAYIEFYHPKGNSLPGSLLQSLANSIQTAGNSNDVKVILLRSIEHEVFCSGTLLEELIPMKTEADGYKFFIGFAQVINAMRKCTKFIVVAVHGKCIGGGVGLVAAADYAIAMEGAEIRLSELCIGFGPFTIGPAIQRKMGLSAFSQLAIDAHMWRSADWARRKGLYAELHPNKRSMEDSIARLLSSLAQVDSKVSAELKKDLWRGTEDWDELLAEKAKISARLVVMDQAREYLDKMKKTILF